MPVHFNLIIIYQVDLSYSVSGANLYNSYYDGKVQLGYLSKVRLG